jgi:hypothetical protein
MMAITTSRSTSVNAERMWSGKEQVKVNFPEQKTEGAQDVAAGDNQATAGESASGLLWCK